MKNQLTLFTLCLFAFGLESFAQNPGVGINTIAPEALFHIQASSVTTPNSRDGLLIPKVTTLPATGESEGLLLYHIPDKAFHVWDGLRWTSLSGNIKGTIFLNDDFTTDPITGNKNNYVPSDTEFYGVEGSNLMRMAPNTDVTITGIERPNPLGNQLIVLRNTGTGTITFTNNDSSSLPRNQFQIGADLILAPWQSTILMYDQIIEKWFFIGT